MIRVSTLVAVIIAPLVLFGCSTTSKSTADAQSPNWTEDARVTVRFYRPNPVQRFSERDSFQESQLASDAFDDSVITQEPRVMLWGNEFLGSDVTFRDVFLAPGPYAFGYWADDGDKLFEGRLQVNLTNQSLLETLKSWKTEIPRQKAWLAEDFELSGKLQTSDARVFKNFAKQLRAFERLERQIDQLIEQEAQQQFETQIVNQQMLDMSRVLIFPGGGGFTHPTTLAAFTDQDVQRADNGESVGRFIIVADAAMSKQKLRGINRLHTAFQACKSVVSEEIDWLERNKRFLITTDHAFDWDREFIENEMRMQQALSVVDRINEQIVDIRERRMAQAFVHQLVAQGATHQPLEEENRDLLDEQAVLQAKLVAINGLMQESDATSPRFIALERRQTRLQRAIDNIDARVAEVNTSQEVLARMFEASNVIYRQSGTRLVAATYIDPETPFDVREALEREAMLTIQFNASPAGSGASNTWKTTASYTGPVDPDCE